MGERGSGPESRGKSQPTMRKTRCSSYHNGVGPGGGRPEQSIYYSVASSEGHDFSIDDTVTEFINRDIVRMMASQGAGSNDSTR
ncbi:hypothetical protein STEG23_025732 [Scotinomys teguina]